MCVSFCFLFPFTICTFGSRFFWHVGKLCVSTNITKNTKTHMVSHPFPSFQISIPHVFFEVLDCVSPYFFRQTHPWGCYDDAWWGYDALALFGRHKGPLSHDTLRMALRRISAKMVASPALSQAWMWGEVRRIVAANVFSKWWFQICSIFIHIWGENDPIWRVYFFKGVQTTNQFVFFHHRFFLVWCVYRLATCKPVTDKSIS